MHDKVTKRSKIVFPIPACNLCALIVSVWCSAPDFQDQQFHEISECLSQNWVKRNKKSIWLDLWRRTSFWILHCSRSCGRIGRRVPNVSVCEFGLQIRPAGSTFGARRERKFEQCVERTASSLLEEAASLLLLLRCGALCVCVCWINNPFKRKISAAAINLVARRVSPFFRGANFAARVLTP